jgi:hypothetical protein
MLLLLFGAIRTAAAGLAAPNELPCISLPTHEKLLLAAGTTDKDEKATIGDPREQSTIGDPDEQTTVGDPGEESTMGDPEEKSEIGDPGEARSLDDPEEKKRF